MRSSSVHVWHRTRFRLRSNAFSLFAFVSIVAGLACAPERRDFGKAVASGGAGGRTPAVLDAGVDARASGGLGGISPVGGAGGGDTQPPDGAVASGGQAGAPVGGTAGGVDAGAVGGGGAPDAAVVPQDAVIFSGATAVAGKLVSDDPLPAEFYVTSPSGVTPTVGASLLTEGERVGAPSGVTFAERLSVTTLGENRLVIGGFNFRATESGRWRWWDGSAYAGVVFWAKASSPVDATVQILDASNFPTTDPVQGTCAAATRAGCPGQHGTTIALTGQWQRFALRWADFVAVAAAQSGPLVTTQLGRVDMLVVSDKSATFDVALTGVRLLNPGEAP